MSPLWGAAMITNTTKRKAHRSSCFLQIIHVNSELQRWHTVDSPFEPAVLVYSVLYFKGKPCHLSQLGIRKLFPSVLSVGPGRGCHLHVTSVYYPNVLVLCIQMEAFIFCSLAFKCSPDRNPNVPDWRLSMCILCSHWWV